METWALSTQLLAGENWFGSAHLEKCSYCKQWFLHSLPFLHGPESQHPMGAAPSRCWGKALHPFLSPMLENKMLAGNVSGSTDQAWGGSQRKTSSSLLISPHPPSLWWRKTPLEVMVPASASKPTASACRNPIPKATGSWSVFRGYQLYPVGNLMEQVNSTSDGWVVPRPEGPAITVKA